MEQSEAGRLLCDFIAGRKIPETKLDKLSPADWESLAVWARRFKVEGLFHREIRSRAFAAGLIPDEVRNRLKQAYRNHAIMNTALFLDAARVLKSLADNRLPVIALKGLALARQIYGDIALRPMVDMDLLVKKEDLVRAGRILLTLGYTQNISAWENMSKTYHHLPPFTNKHGAMIELHWDIVSPDCPITVDVDGLWERVCLITVDDVEVRAFGPEDLLLHLCVHACYHLQFGLDLTPLCDVAGLIKTAGNKIDWQIVIERATRWGGNKCVYLMLLLVQELLGAAPPDNIMSALKPDDYQPRFFDEALEQIFDVSPASQMMGIGIGKLSRIREMKGIKGKMSALLKEAFPSRENMARISAASGPSRNIYLHYLFRIGRGVVFYTTVLVRLFRRDPSLINAVNRAHRVNAVSDWMYKRAP